MDIFKKIMEIFNSDSFVEEHEGLSRFVHNVTSDNGEERILTMATTEEGIIVLSAFTPSQWEMACHIAEVSNKTIPEIVCELSNDGDIPTLTIDPRE